VAEAALEVGVGEVEVGEEESICRTLTPAL
jgi:hypothetical protein